MLAKKSLIITPISFCEIDTWDPKRIHGQSGFQTNYPLVPFSKVLHEAEIEWVDIDNAKEYQILGVHAYGEGVYVNHTAKGSEMTMRRYQKSKANCLFWCKVRTVRGQFGVVYPQFESTYGSSNMKYMAIDTTRIIPQFLELLFQKNALTDYMDTLAIGSNSRHFNPSVFLKVRFPLPSIAEQQTLLDKYNASMKKANEADNQSKALNDGIDSFILEYTNCSKSQKESISSAILRVKSFSKMMNWGAKLNSNAISPKELFLSKQYKNVALSTISEVNPTTTYSEELANKSITFLPMKCISDVYGEIADKRCGHISDSKGYTRFQENDILWAKITPCMQNGKCAVARGLENGYGYGSTEYHVIRANTDKVLPEYLYCFLRTQLVRKVAQTYFSGSAGQQRVGADFLENLNIPLIPIRSDDQSQITQEKMVKQVFEVKAEIKALRGEAESLRQRAKKEFEEAVFGA